MEPLVQFRLLAQRPGMEEWVNILFIVVLAVLYLVGALVKAASRKGRPQQGGREGLAKEQPRERETWQKRLARKAEEIQRAAEAQGRRAVERARQMEQEAGLREQGGRPRPTQPPAGRITIRPGQGGESIMVYEQPESRPPVERPQPVRAHGPRETVAPARQRAAQTPPPTVPSTGIAGPIFEPLAEDPTSITFEPPKPLKLREQRWETPGGSASLHPAALIDYSDPDALKKAILHYEILGKPIALRDPSRQIASF